MSKFSSITSRHAGAITLSAEKKSELKSNSSSSEEKKLALNIPKQTFFKAIPRPKLNQIRHGMDRPPEQNRKSIDGERSPGDSEDSALDSSQSSNPRTLQTILPKFERSTRATPSSIRSPRNFLQQESVPDDKESNMERLFPTQERSPLQRNQSSAGKRNAFAESKRQAPVAKREVFAVKFKADAKKSKLQRIRANLPAGVNLDDNGVLTGTTRITQTPKAREGEVNQFPQLEGLDFQVYYNKKLNEALNGNRTEIADQSLVAQAKSDFFRLDYEFCHENGDTFRSYDLNIPREAQNERNEAVTRALRQFAGSDAATTVLSSILHQGFSSAIPRALSNADGFSINHLRIISAMNTATRQIYIVNDDGSRVQVVNPLGLAGAKMKLSHHQTDFKLSIEWQAFYEAKPDQKDLLPLGENEVVGVQFRAEFLVNGDLAHTVISEEDWERNVMDLTISDQIQATFSGRLQVD